MKCAIESHQDYETFKNESNPIELNVDYRSESSSTYDMIIGNQPSSPWRIRHNHELQ
jgi:hypothetical protein